MLYKESVIKNNQEQFIFDGRPYNEDIDFKEIAGIENFYEKNGYIPSKYIPDFLNWLIYMARKNITNPLESVMDVSMSGQCAIAQGYLAKMLKKLSLPFITFNVGDVLGCTQIHALTQVSIPTLIEGESNFKNFILDPTFRQFCLVEENRFERYNEEPRWGVRMSTPHPGYFFNLTDAGKAFANNLICFGYFEATDENLKQYFDSFALYITPKEAYDNKALVGKIPTTDTSGSEYSHRVSSSAREYGQTRGSFDYETPKERIEFQQKRFLNRLKHKLNRNNELYKMFEITDTGLENTNKFTK